VSVRGLQMAFRKTLDMTPLDYLRRVRLSEAHRELQAATPDATTVTDVSRRWGFTNSSRFAHAYREEFGESPRQTLQR
jgi:transcriptional regulator GlxA family with amidase domain